MKKRDMVDPRDCGEPVWAGGGSGGWFDHVCAIAIVTGALAAAVTIGIKIGAASCR